MQKKVLVVEDNGATRAALNVTLSKSGLEVIEASDGTQGLALARDTHPDLILLDILMPTMDGWEMLKELRETDDWGKCVPVIMLTNLSPDDDIQIHHITAQEPSFFMVKADWTVEDVAEKVQEVLSAPQVPCP